MLATTGVPARNTDPWNAAGKKPLLKLSRPPGGISPPLRTRNVGKSLFPDPRPYPHHAPQLGRPWTPLPVCRK